MYKRCYSDSAPNIYFPATARHPRTPGIYIAPSVSKKHQKVFIDNSAKLSPTLVTELQAIIGTLLYYARAVDPTLQPIANELASQQANATRRILNAANRALSYCAAHRTRSPMRHTYAVHTLDQ